MPDRLAAIGIGVVGAAASIFFAYVGFDAVSTAAEETKNPQRNMPIGLIGCLLICTIFYLLVAAGAIGAIGAQPIDERPAMALVAGSPELAAPARDRRRHAEPLVCSKEALAHVLREIGWSRVGNMIGLAAFLALPSVVLMMMFGQTRIFFVMAATACCRSVLSKVHPKYQHAACGHDHHRHRAWRRRGVLPGRQAGRHLQLGHAVRLRRWWRSR